MRGIFVLLVALTLVGCSPAATSDNRGPAPAPPPRPERPLVIFVRVEPATVATRAFVQKGTGLHAPLRLFNALLTLIDDRGLPRPELLASLPSLNTGSWQVFPDGTMQTTYTLRPNLTWHDGEPFTSDDLAFSWRVYSSRDLGLANQAPMNAISDVQATDPEHFTIQWKVPYPDADTLATYNLEFPPLPQHILGTAFENMATTGRDAFATHPFWGPQFVGLGPYRMQQWTTGSSIDAVRFSGYALGVPKIARVQFRFSADQNVVVANLLSGDAHAATDSSIGQAAETLTEQWAQSKAGTVFQWPNAWRAIVFQLRPELANPNAVLDPRVRKAVAHSIDKQAISDGVYAGSAIFATTPVWSGSAWGPALDDSIATYPFDTQTAASLMSQVGIGKGSDGFYQGTDGRLSVELATTEDPDNVREILVLADGLRNAGYDVQQRVLPAALAQDAQVRASFSAMQVGNTNMGEPALHGLAGSQIPTPNNRWLGGNRGAWVSPTYDRLLETFNTTLDRNDRMQLVRQMLRVYADDLPSISLFFRAQPFAYVNALRGPGKAAPESNVAWNVYEWEFD